MIAALLWACTGPGGVSPPVAAPTPSVLLVTLDTTRADALGTYGGPAGLTPHLDALATQGVVFDEAMATAPLTAPSHASLLTGRYPFAHGVRNNLHYVLDDDVPSLAEAFRDAGWATAAFVSASVLDARIGLDRGFTTYVDDVPDRAETPMAVPSRDGADIVDLAAAWFHEQVSAHPAQPVFLWVHLYDAHAPYAPADGFAHRHRDPYLAEVAELDHHVGSLHRALVGRDPDRHWVRSVIGDHGEGRGDHGEAAHGLLLYRSTLRVPWLLSGPGVPAGRRVEATVSQVDLPVTLAALAGVPFDTPHGRDLRPAWGPSPPPSPPAYAETLVPLETYGLAPLFAVQHGAERAQIGLRDEAFDWRADPAEHTPIDPTAAAARARAWMRNHPGAGEAPGHDDPTAQLAALGYLAGVPGGLPSSHGLADPRDHVDLPQRVADTVHRAHTLAPADGAVLLDELRAAYPGVLQLHGELAAAWGAAGEPARGLAELDALPLPSTHPYVASRRASLLQQLGDVDRARAELAAAHQLTPSHAQLAVAYASALHQAGAHDDALEVLGRAELSSQSFSAQLLQGRLRLATGRPEQAVDPLRAAWALEPDHPEVLRLLAPTLATVGWTEEAVAVAQHARRVDPASTWAIALLGRIAWARGGCDAADPQLTQLRDLHPPPDEATGLLRDCPP